MSLISGLWEGIAAPATNSGKASLDFPDGQAPSNSIQAYKAEPMDPTPRTRTSQHIPTGSLPSLRFSGSESGQPD